MINVSEITPPSKGLQNGQMNFFSSQKGIWKSIQQLAAIPSALVECIIVDLVLEENFKNIRDH